MINNHNLSSDYVRLDVGASAAFAVWLLRVWASIDTPLKPPPLALKASNTALICTRKEKK